MPVTYKYRVKRGNSIFLNRGKNENSATGTTMLKPGAFLPENYPAKKIPGLIRSGKVERIQSVYFDEVIDAPVAIPPGTEITPLATVKKDGFLDGSKGGDFARSEHSAPTVIRSSASPSDLGDGVIEVSSEKIVKPTAATAATTQQTPWVLDPAGLADKTLDQLNVMIAERDATQEAFSTTQEAIAFLSMDFVPPTAK